jgi:diguanylate cyclase (GGDEF)-like protein/PAS domain S-box-containing protein
MKRLCMDNLLNTPEEHIFFKDLDSRFLLVSRGLLEDQVPGRSLADVLGKTDFDIFSEPHAVGAFEDEQRIIRTGEPLLAKLERETFYDRPDTWVSTTKVPLRDDDGSIIGTFGISRDVTAQVAAEQALTFQSLHDPVTGLANRVALMDRLSQALASLERQPGRVVLLFIDLDNFKAINDSYGHETGDKVLVEVARRLSGTLRRADTVARLGGDEFVMLCTTMRDDDPRSLGDRIVRVVRQPYIENGLDLSITASVGIVVTRDGDAEAGELLQDADVAMYEAKEAGKNCFEIFTPSQRDRVVANHTLESELREAIEAGDLFLLYQPLFSIADNSLCGVEALVRWNHPARGVVPPIEFIPLAEQRGLITQIDSFVLEEACRQLAEWLAEGGWPDDFTMAVNISGRDFVDPSFPEHVGSVLAAHGVEPSRLCLEITETAYIGEAGDIEPTLKALSALGVRIALDDFGTGYSTLAHLQRLQVDILKIDGSFVERLGRSSRDREIVGAMTAMVHALGMVVVAEAIETDEQLDELTSLECDVGQGYLFARPLAAAAVAELRRSAPRSVLPSAPLNGRRDHVGAEHGG